MKRFGVAGLLVLVGCGGSSATTDDDGRTVAAPVDGAADDASAHDGGPTGSDGGVSSGDSGTPTPAARCGTGPMVDIDIPFPSGNRKKRVRAVVDSFGTSAPPAGTVFMDPYTPGPGECSVETHDRYWVCGDDGMAYRTWHPASTTDVVTGKSCSFGHEHGDDPRTSPLYTWAGGTPFSMINHLAANGGHHRHEDHVGHKVFVQTNWEGALGNPPDGGTISSAGFRCHWLSQLHQGSHSGDALGMNEHEYQNTLMCDDGQARFPEAGYTYSTATHHTEASVRTLATIGAPGSFKACDGLTLTPFPGDGRAPPAGSDTNREIKCARADQGWVYHSRPTQIVGPRGEIDVSDGTPDGAAIAETWKPWLSVVTRSGKDIYTASGYYMVLNPARLYNDGSVVPKRDVDGDGVVDSFIPTLEFCLKKPNEQACKGLPTFPANVPPTEWWKLPQSPFKGDVRVLHPKGVNVRNTSTKTVFCTDYRGVEVAADATADADGVFVCPAGTIRQQLAATWNLWGDGHANWGPNRSSEHPGGSMVNARNNNTKGSGFGHEWVRFNSDSSVHAPN